MRIFKKILILFTCLCLLLCAGCNKSEYITLVNSTGEHWYYGFGCADILPDPESDQPLYIAGYNNGLEVYDVADYCQARALWLDTGAQGMLIIGIDTIALDSGVVGQIRQRLADLPNCAAVHVYSTHTHAGADTLGLWGPVGVDGKNDAYMASLIEAAEMAGRDAHADRKEGRLFFGKVETEDMYRDSRDPQVYDPYLYQLRFEPTGDFSLGLRMFFYGAHAESMRGDNVLLSRDFPGRLCDEVGAATGDDTLFAAGAIGGLIMTKEFAPTDALNSEVNRDITADKLIAYALSITSKEERELSPRLSAARSKFVVPLDNGTFVLYKTLGILTNDACPAASKTGYGVRAELNVCMLDDVALTLIPGEIFPELVYGGEFGDANPEGVNPEPLCDIAERYGVKDVLIVGLANDELGYIVPPSDFLLNKEAPYFEKTIDYKDENHYEETNSVGPDCADKIAENFEQALKKASLS